MQWGVIFGSASILQRFSGLSDNEKAIVGAAYLYRQLRLIEQFDACYDEDLTQVFKEGVVACANTNLAAVQLVERVESKIPDTDEFPEEEGAYAQNLFIALKYLLEFVFEGGVEAFESAISMAMENIDVINYNIDPNYDESAALTGEVAVASSIIDKLALRRQKRSGLDLLNWLCAGNFI
ncbi:hypothetical protein [Pseudomonas sp. BNK-30]|uniref:hypothetical protein n=1 Tax=Pseudomonas sp. BNK-30 TaxID=3376165 RepID=UPI0039BF24BE